MRRFKPSTCSWLSVKRVLPFVFALLLLVPVSSTIAQTTDRAEVVVVEIEGTVTRGTSMHVDAGVSEAEERGVPLVIVLDTPGGLVDATLEIRQSVERSEVPVLTWVGPRGAISQSAGTFIFLMGQPNGMAEGTQIGSAEPVAGGPGGGGNVSDKTVNFLIGQMRGIADRTDRDQDVAERFITENLNLNQSEALRLGMSDTHANSLPTFLDAVHGEEAIAGDDVVTLNTMDANIVVVERGAVADLTDLISNPTIVFLLFLVGLYGVVFGLAAPGTYVAETVGALALVLALIGMGLFSTSWAGILLILLAAVFFIAELFTPTHGLLTVAGVVAMILGALFVIDEPLLSPDFLTTFRVIAIVSAVLTGIAVLVAVWVAVRQRDEPATMTMEGEVGKATTRLDPTGQVHVKGELWQARAEDPPIEEGATVRVTHREGLKIRVRSDPQAEFPEPEEAVAAPGEGSQEEAEASRRQGPREP